MLPSKVWPRVIDVYFLTVCVCVFDVLCTLKSLSGRESHLSPPDVQTVCAKPLASHQAQALLRDMREHGLSANKAWRTPPSPTQNE